MDTLQIRSLEMNAPLSPLYTNEASPDFVRS